MNSSLLLTAVAVFFTTVLTACGGGSSVSAGSVNNAVNPPETGNSTVTPPGNGSAIVWSDLNKQEALSALNPLAIDKVDPGFLNRLLDQTTNDVTVAFVNDSSSTDSLDTKMNMYASAKKRVAAGQAPSEYEVIVEYNTLPMSFVRFKSRRALVNLLNNVDVKAIYENQQHVGHALNKQEALSALGPAAISKVHPEFLGRILEQTSSEVIVEFVDQSSQTDSLEQKIITHANTRSRVATALASSDYEIITEYRTFPVSFIRFKSRHALVNFLNNPYVIAIYENREYSIPALPTIGAVPAARGNTEVVVTVTGVSVME